jgi:hypothetical protein
MKRFIVFATCLLAPSVAFATPFFNHLYSEAGYFLDANNVEARSYECKATFDFTIVENGVTRSQHVEQKLVVPPKWSGRLFSMPSTPQSFVRTFNYNISCN